MRYLADLQSVHGLRCYGNITRTRNVSEYMLALALCLVMIIIIAIIIRTMNCYESRGDVIQTMHFKDCVATELQLSNILIFVIH